jgi:molecular chaperone GrpE
VSSETGKFSADIGADVIADALESVEKHEQESPAAGSAPPADEDPEAMAALQAQVEALETANRELSTRLDEERERTLRALADLDNTRKRAQREREDVVRFGLERVLKDLLPVVDNLDRAVELGERTGTWEGLGEGVRMTRKLLEDTLARQGLRAFTARGQPFDPQRHEAMGHEDRTDVPADTVSTEVLRGFTLHDRLVRPALVMVARPPPAPDADRAPEAPPAVVTDVASPSPAGGEPEEEQS